MTAPVLFDPEIETLSPAELRRRQEPAWARQWDYVTARSAFYREKLGAAARASHDLDRLQELPFSEKDDLRRAQEAAPPFGDYVACAPEKIIRLHHTSGSTGRKLILAYSKSDAETVARVGARGMTASGLRPGDRVVHCLNYRLWTGGVTDHLILEAAGATVIPFGVGEPAQLIETIRDLGVTAISCTPSYPALLERVLRESFHGLSPRDLGLRLALFGGEAGLDNAGFRDRLEQIWGFGARNANYGLSEVMSVLGSQCEATRDLHFIGGDAVFAEVLDPASGQRQPIRDGASGELVCTHLAKECQPLIRYRTRDVIEITGAGPCDCDCGRASFRFRVIGRSDDMFNVRGVNVFPSAAQRVIQDHPSLASGHFRILLRGPGPYDRLSLRVEAARSLAPDAWQGAARTLEAALKATLGASAQVEMTEFESFPRTDGKTSLIQRS